MIVLFTDFGWQGPYVGQMKAVLLHHAPQQAVIDLMHDAPAFNPKASAYLLNALRQQFLPGSIFLAVVDPGVGSAERRAIIVQADGQWFVGPDNGLFEIIARTATVTQYWEITWRPEQLSASFHGRDIFAPVAATIANEQTPGSLAQPVTWLASVDWPTELAEIVYIDHYGNAVTGLSAAMLTTSDKLVIGEKRLAFGRTFSARPIGEAFWYFNSIGLVELAVNQGSFKENYNCEIGSRLTIE